MDFPSALMWLIQNPTGFLTIGAERCLGLTPRGALYDFAPKTPAYARFNGRDLVRADWQPMTREDIERAAEQAKGTV